MLKRLVASILDEVLAVVMGLVLLLVFEGILRLIGFQMVKEYWATFGVIALTIANIIYFSIGEKSIGKKALNV